MAQMETPGRVIGLELNVSPSHTIKEVGALFANRDGVLLTDYFFTVREKVNGVLSGAQSIPIYVEPSKSMAWGSNYRKLHRGSQSTP